MLDSYQDNLSTDCIVSNLSDEVCAEYLRSWDKKVLTNPIAAPYYGDYTGCPPVELWVSDSEVLRDDSYILFEKLKELKNNADSFDSIDSKLQVWTEINDIINTKVAPFLDIISGEDLINFLKEVSTSAGSVDKSVVEADIIELQSQIGSTIDKISTAR